MIILATDGSCSGNGRPDCIGGWAYVMDVPGVGARYVACGGERGTTNNRMELLAAIHGLQACPAGSEVQLLTDSSYLARAIQQRWIPKWRSRNWMASGGKPVANRDLWERLAILLERHRVSPALVKGHSGHVLNEYADGLAVAATAHTKKVQRNWSVDPVLPGSMRLP